MKKHRKPAPSPTKTTGRQTALELEQRAALRMSLTPDTLEPLDALLAIASGDTSTGTALSPEWAQREVSFARALNLSLPDDAGLALNILQVAVCQLLQVRECHISLGAPTERERLSSPDLLGCVLYDQRTPVGFVSLSDTITGEPWTASDRVALELLSPYLATHVARLYRQRSHSQDDLSRKTLLKRHAWSLALSEKLLMAMDANAVFTLALENACRHLGFDVAQVVMPAPEDMLTANNPSDDSASDSLENSSASLPSGPFWGDVLYEIRTSGPQAHRVISYAHAGLKATDNEFPTIMRIFWSLSRLSGKIVLSSGWMATLRIFRCCADKMRRRYPPRWCCL